MIFAARAICVAVALLHFYFLLLQMFLWKKPLGRKTFRTDEAFAARSAPLAANQGLYNGFLASGLLFALAYPEPEASALFTRLFLIFIMVAGLFGAATANRRILWIQFFPGLVAFLALGWAGV